MVLGAAARRDAAADRSRFPPNTPNICRQEIRQSCAVCGPAVSRAGIFSFLQPVSPFAARTRPPELAGIMRTR
jgi:hypothetical protein